MMCFVAGSNNSVSALNVFSCRTPSRTTTHEFCLLSLCGCIFSLGGQHYIDDALLGTCVVNGEDYVMQHHQLD